jgi:predicted nuclease of restriction endonuclease-like (RecB) superfamily
MEKHQLPVPARQQKQLLGDIRALIEAAKNQVARTVNTGLVSLYWTIGKRIEQDVLQDKRAAYGKEIVQTLSGQLVAEYGKGFSAPGLFRMVKFVEKFSDPAIVATLSPQLGWSHFVELLPMEDPLKRDYYAEMCRLERWSVRTLRTKIGGMLYERTALSKKPVELAALELKKLRDDDRLTPDMVFRDPYFLDFLHLKGAFQEKDLEAALLREMESFVLELGEGFAFVARQKRLQIGDRDYWIDLLFYHRGLRRLVVIDLKLDRFKPEFKGQMELYLRWLDKHERGPGEESPIGLILCAGKSGEEVELLQLDQSGIRVAEYMTELPPRRLLEKKLHEALRLARERIKELPH